MYKYVGTSEHVFLAYRDLQTGGTLLAKPGEMYEVSPVPPASLFVEVVEPTEDNNDSDGE